MPALDAAVQKEIAANARKLRRQGQPTDVAFATALKLAMEERKRRQAMIPPIPKGGRTSRE